MQERFQNFTFFISKINKCIRKIKQEEMANFDLKISHVFCIYYLYVCGALTSKELSDICEEDKASVSRAVEYLEKNGYVILEENQHRKYRRPIKLTDRGEQIGKYLTERIDRIIAVSSEGLSEEERAVLYKALGVICDNLQKVCQEY